MNKYLEKLKNNKIIAVILIIGIVLMLVPSDRKEKIVKDNTEYAENLEKDLCEMISRIEGAGEVYVMVTLEDKGQTFPLTDVNGKGESIQQKTVSVSGEIAISKENYPKVRGVAVAASGADRSSVRENIVEAAQALTGAELHNIKVFKLKR